MSSLTSTAPQASPSNDGWDQGFRSMADALPTMIWVSGADQLCKWCNEAWLQFTGHDLTQEIGSDWEAGVYLGDIERFRTAYTTSFDARTQFELEFRLKHRSGGYRWVIASAGPVYSPDGDFVGYIGSCVDIHDRKTVEEESRTSAEHFRALADATPQQVATALPDGSVDWLSRQWFEYSGYSLEDLCGNQWAEKALHPDDLSPTLEQWRLALQNTEPFELEHRLRRRDGEYRWHVTRAVPVRDRNGEILLWILVNTDIDAIKQAHEGARRASRAKDEFLAALSHELRTPLTPVLLLAAELQADTTLPEEHKEAIRIIRHNAELEARLIDDLLDLTRVIHGKLRIRPEVTDLHALLAYTAEVVRTAAREKHIDIRFDLTATEPYVRADSARLQQVAWNLLNNAVKFTPKEGTIRVRSHNPRPGCICLEVQDTGIGIPEDRQKQIFNAFDQGGLTGDHRFGGLGLGLAISKAIMELHGGNLSVSSAGEGMGATFSAYLDTVPAPTVVAAPAKERLVQVRPLRILLVEDHAPTLNIIARLLKRDGHTVTAASTVAAAVDTGLAGEFDVLLSDLGLPDGTGCDVMEHLRRFTKVKGIALSGYGMDADIERAERAGFVRHLTKPIDFKMLRQALDDLTLRTS